ncbi:MAG: hypothetical protein ACO1Q7_17550 [Gemmatimonas sp.]
MKTSTTSVLSRFIRKIATTGVLATLAACSGGATEPELPATTFVSIVVSCDVAVHEDAGNWRVSFCTLSLNGLSGSSLIMPADSNTDANRARRDLLTRFGACMNRKTTDEQKQCYPMLES